VTCSFCTLVIAAEPSAAAVIGIFVPIVTTDQGYYDREEGVRFFLPPHLCENEWGELLTGAIRRIFALVSGQDTASPVSNFVQPGDYDAI
jgi:hypothetical protein